MLSLTFVREYLGGADEVEGEDWEDVIVDAPLTENPKYHYELREVSHTIKHPFSYFQVAPCPEGFTHHSAFLIDDIIWCFNSKSAKFEYFDPENEMWIEREVSVVPLR